MNKLLTIVTAATATAWAIRRRAKRKAARRQAEHLHFETHLPPGVRYPRTQTTGPDYVFNPAQWEQLIPPGFDMSGPWDEFSERYAQAMGWEINDTTKSNKPKRPAGGVEMWPPRCWSPEGAE